MSRYSRHPTLTDKTYQRCISDIMKSESDLAEVVSRWGNPPFWVHTPGFPGIVIAILSQQVSLESAQATFTKLENAIESINPEKFLSMDDKTLRKIGFSRQKASYVRGVASEIMVGDFDLEDLEAMDNNQARKRLMEIRGIGEIGRASCRERV